LGDVAGGLLERSVLDDMFAHDDKPVVFAAAERFQVECMARGPSGKSRIRARTNLGNQGKTKPRQELSPTFRAESYNDTSSDDESNQMSMTAVYLQDDIEKLLLHKRNTLIKIRVVRTGIL